MNSAVCTLFEGNYHYGVASLINSLYLNGYQGNVYAGYRGELPSWLSEANNTPSLLFPGSKSLRVADDLHLHLLPLTTEYHLTNYKPDFMISLLNGPASGVDAIYYFDPDIVVTGPWHYYEQWVKCGVALCEDINSPMAESHPRRIAWRKYFLTNNFILKFKSQTYANGGFIGVNAEDFEFLSLWKKVQEAMAPAIGGLTRSSLPGSSLPEHASGEFDPFPKSDQDALNCSIEAWEGIVSFVGKDGMAFQPGLTLMSHAVGPVKPWKWKPMTQFFQGFPPRKVDKDYWRCATGPILAHTNNLIKFRNRSIKVASFLGRFYERGD